MPRAGVTYMDVADAATELTGEGINPTIEQVRRKLGTGSSTTIANHLRAWKEHIEQETSISVNETLPQDLISMMKGLWQKVINHSEEKIQTFEAESHDRISELVSDLEKYKLNNKRWQKLFNRWVQEKAELHKEQQTQSQELTEVRRLNDQLIIKNTMLVEQLTEKQTYIMQLQHEIKLMQDKIEQDKQRAEEQHASLQARFDHERQQLKLETKQVKQQNEAIKEKMIALQGEHRDLRHAHTTLGQQYANVISQHEKLSTKFKEKDKENGLYKQKLNVIETYQAELKNENQQLKTEIIDARAATKVVEHRVSELEKDLLRAHKEISRLEYLTQIEAPA